MVQATLLRPRWPGRGCLLTVAAAGHMRRLPTPPRIDQSMPIVAETEQIVDRRNFSFELSAQISDGLGIHT
jgi:hypothetical protein